jgi:hypothetical protein
MMHELGKSDSAIGAALCCARHSAAHADWRTMPNGFGEDTVCSRICRWSSDHRPASGRHSLTSYGATSPPRASELVLDKTCCVKLDDLSVWSILQAPELAAQYSSVIKSSSPQLKVRAQRQTMPSRLQAIHGESREKPAHSA